MPEPLSEQEIKLASAHFNRVASPELKAKMNAKDPRTGLRLGDDEEVLRAWLHRARSTNEGFATVLYGADPKIDEQAEISRARRQSDEIMRDSMRNRQHPRPDADRLAAALWPESRR